MQCVGIDDRGHWSALEHSCNEVGSRRLTTQTGTKHKRVSPLEGLSNCGLELPAEGRLDREYIRETRRCGGNRVARGDELHETSPGGEGGTRGMECRAAHSVGTADDTHPAAVPLVHLRRKPRQPRRCPRIGHQHRPR
jgi:hypothetical protein